MNWLFNTFLNPDVADPIREAIGEDEFAMRKGKAMEELTGVDKRMTPVKEGFLKGLVGDSKGVSLSFEGALDAYKEGKLEGKRFWSIWKDKLEEQGYFLAYDYVLRNPTPEQLKEMQKGYKMFDLSEQGTIDKVLKEEK